MCVCVYVFKNIHTYMHICACICVEKHIHTYVYVFIYMYFLKQICAILFKAIILNRAHLLSIALGYQATHYEH